MSRVPTRGGLRERCPAFFSLTSDPLSGEDALNADFNRRIASIWKFLGRRILTFQETLRPRERANFDPEDTLQALYIVLCERDHKWIPERGRYITFAASIADRFFCTIREQARAVEGPRNAHSRLKDYELDAEAGETTKAREETADQLRSVMGSQDSWSTGRDIEGGSRPDDEAEGHEHREIAKSALLAALAGLNPYEAVVLGQRFGLWGKPEKSVKQIAADSGRSTADIRTDEANAKEKLRNRLCNLKHVATRE